MEKINLKLYVKYLEHRLEQQKHEAENYKEWLNDLLADSDSTIYLNVCNYAGKLATALHTVHELESSLEILKQYCDPNQ